MDPFTATVLGMVAIAGGLFVLKNVPYFIAAHYEKTKNEQRARQDELERSPEYQEEAAKKRNLANMIDKKKRISFVGLKNKNKVFELNLREEFQFDINKDVVLKGTLRCFDENHKMVVRPIYLYQPRLFASKANGSGEICIGPKLKDGKLNKNYMYMTKRPGEQGEIYYGYVPKAEISSGLEYDFDKDNPYNANYRIFDYINITFDYDKDGNVVPVDLSKKEERDALLAYIRENQNSYAFYEYSKIASKSLDDELEKEKMQRYREDAEYKSSQRAAEKSQTDANKTDKQPDKEQEEYRKYYDYMYGHYGTKSFYNKFDDVRRVNGEPPFAPPHDEPHEPHEPHGPRR